MKTPSPLMLPLAVLLLSTLACQAHRCSGGSQETPVSSADEPDTPGKEPAARLDPSDPSETRPSEIDPEPAGTEPSPQEASQISNRGDEPLHVFYVVHVQMRPPFRPYRSARMQQLDTASARNLLAITAGIAEVADDHGLPVTWQLTEGVARAVRELQGADNLFARLEDRGHEVGAHVTQMSDPARVRQAVAALGVTPVARSGMVKTRVSDPDLERAMASVVAESREAGFHVITGNFSPADRQSPGGGGRRGLPLVGFSCEMGTHWNATANLVEPWRPDYQDNAVCEDDPQGDIVMVDHISAGWLMGHGPGMLTHRHFQDLEDYVQPALELAESSDDLLAWGWISHLTQYAPGRLGSSPPDEAPLDALDAWLDTLDREVAAGRMTYDTVGGIARQWRSRR